MSRVFRIRPPTGAILHVVLPSGVHQFRVDAISWNFLSRVIRSYPLAWVTA